MNKELEKIERKLNKALDKEKKINQDIENLTLEQELIQEEISKLQVKKRRDIAQENTSITDDEAYQLFQTLSSKKISTSEALKALQKNQEGNN